MAFLMNAWYCAGWAYELEETGHFARKLLDKFVLIFRTEDGDVSAMSNVCPHRFAALSKGTRKGDNFACPYHGIEFDKDGTCVHNPLGDGKIPKSLKLETYPLIERWGALWIWMGDAEKADPNMIPDFSMASERPGWKVVRGMHETKAHYELVVDNLMDRTHVQFLHPILQYTEERPDNFYSEHSVEVVNDRMLWDYHADYNSPMFKIVELLWPEAPKDRMMNYFDVRWEAPGNMLLHSAICEMDTDRKVGSHTEGANLITPADEETTYYFWSQARDRNIDDEKIDEGLYKGVAHTFKNEDGAMVADCALHMGTNDLFSLKPVLLPTDEGAVRVRRMMAQLIKAEQEEKAQV